MTDTYTLDSINDDMVRLFDHTEEKERNNCEFLLEQTQEQNVPEGQSPPKIAIFIPLVAQFYIAPLVELTSRVVLD